MSRRAHRAIAAAAILVTAAWLLGRVASDRWAWSQWLLWIPTPLATVVAAGALAAAAGARRRGCAIAWALVTLGLAGVMVLFEHRVLRGDRGGGSVTLVHWNLTHGDPGDPDRFAEAISRLDADVVVLTNAGTLLTDPRVRRWAAPPRAIAGGHPFAVVSRLPVIECHPLVNTRDGIHVTRLVVDAGGPLTLWLMDLPSDPRRGRMTIARRAAALLAGTGVKPDLIVGDLNITRGSAALATLAPEHEHAFTRAGRGWGGTFPRLLPLYHIDHVLAAPGVPLAGYRTEDPGVGMHRLQIVELDPPRHPAD